MSGSVVEGASRAILLGCVIAAVVLSAPAASVPCACASAGGATASACAAAAADSGVGAVAGDGGAAVSREDSAEAGDGAGVAGGEADSGDREDGRAGWLKRLGAATLSVVGRVVLYLILLIGLVLIPLGLGGTFVMVAAAAVFALLTGFEQITLRLLAVLLGLALVGEGVESLLGVAMARRYGASKWGMWGAFLGGIVGAIVGAPVPVVGNVVGALIGVFAGAFALEWIGQGRSGSSLRAGWGALLGRTAAGAIKIALGMVIMILIISRTLS
jgi:uncharacterized protein YqgC (DUF456 family)